MTLSRLAMSTESYAAFQHFMRYPEFIILGQVLTAHRIAETIHISANIASIAIISIRSSVHFHAFPYKSIGVR